MTEEVLAGPSIVVSAGISGPAIQVRSTVRNSRRKRLTNPEKMRKENNISSNVARPPQKG